MKYSISGLFSIIVVLCAFQAKSQINPKQLEDSAEVYFESLVSEKSPGSAVLVVKDGSVILNKGYGLANLEHGIAITPTTVFDLASVSKQFTGFAISTLVENGQISLDDDVRTYIPELPDFGHTITIDHLIHHTSGIRDWTSILPLAGWSFDDVISFDQIKRMTFLQQELNFEPGSEYSYSNSGYNLLAELVARVSGKSFGEWTHENIFEPLGMTQSLFLEDHRTVIPQRALGYSHRNGEYQLTPNNLTAIGSSSLYSTTTDLAKWVNNLDNPKVGIRSIIDRMYKRGILNNGDTITYAFGLGIGEFNGTKRIAHSGSWASFRTYLAYYPEHHLSVVVLNNNPDNAYVFAAKISSWLLPDKSSQENISTDESVKFKIPKKILDDFTGTYRLGPAWYVTITNKDGELWTKATMEGSFPMVAESKSRFRIEAYGGRTMTFSRDDSGEVTYMEYDGLTCPKLSEDSVLIPEDLSAYTGVYRSTELLTDYSVVEENGKLQLHHHRNGIIDLNHAWGQDFRGSMWFLGSVEFQKDGNGEITGFAVSSGRARNQKFLKIKSN